MYNGMINVYKERGYTSHDVVAKLRGILHQKKIGHTGTLDPDAVGVLPVCLGKGTKLADLITDHDKTYQAKMQLGLTTDTQDISGNVLKARPVTVSAEEVFAAIMAFTGDYMQVPPMYSAIKIGGKKLYEIARAGGEVARPARHVFIRAIDDVEILLPYVTMTVDCSKGTYIRTLCHDIGETLGCGACMTELVRTAVGPFRIEGARTLSEIEEAAAQRPDDLGGLLIPLETMLGHLPKLEAKDAAAGRLLRNGNILDQGQVICPAGESPAQALKEDADYRLYTEDGRFAAVYTWTGHLLKSKKMFI